MDHAVPLDCEAIGHLQNSALALDVYSWLTHRLWRVRERNGIELSWPALQAQFGQEYRDRKNFKREFTGALKKVTAAYKDARVEAVPGGLRLLPSPPPVKRKMIALPASVPTSRPAPSPAPVVAKDLVSVDALEKVPSIAPGWDKYALAERYRAWVADLGEMPRNPDAAFLGWVKKFTKGKRP
jgi:hypothetical protein